MQSPRFWNRAIRGRCARRDGRIHTDSATKFVTALFYFNDPWEATGGPVATGPDLPRVPSNYRAGEPRARLVLVDEVLGHLGQPGQTLVDARAPARYRGETEPLDPVAGHIPGALNRPFGLNLGEDGRFKSPEVLRAEFEQLLQGRAAQDVVHHCGSGVSAVPNLLAMEIAGLGRSALYAGSWSEWCRDATRPVARG